MPVLLFKNSMVEIGIASAGFPVKGTANDGSAAWTLRRGVYVLFVSLPFAGLTDFLSSRRDIQFIGDKSWQ